MARPPTFDRREVVDAAMEVFWEHGYQGASLSRLGEAMGLKPGSIYAAFGSKDALFQEALDAYVEKVRQAAYHPERGARALLEGWFEAHLEAATETGGRGCMLLTAAAESPRIDPGGARAVRAQLDALERLFRHTVAKARRDTPRPDAPGPAATARLLVAALAGISAMSRAGTERRALADVARAALALV